MKSSEIKIGELLRTEEPSGYFVFGVVYHKNDGGRYLVDWCDGFATGEEYYAAEIDKWRMPDEK